MKVHIKVLFVAITIAICVGVAGFLSRPGELDVVASTKRNVDNEVIAGYRSWTRANAEPEIIPSRLAQQCAMLSRDQLLKEENNPHSSKFIVVYVNDIGRSQMMERKLPVFPVGSVIVKEKLTTRESTSPELLTVMRKREPGYDPDKGDWEYMVFDGAGQNLQASGKLEKCQACHLDEKRTDYVSRAYLPYEIYQKLK